MTSPLPPPSDARRRPPSLILVSLDVVTSGAQFLGQAEAEFAELHDDFASEVGLLHNQMHAFTRLTQDAINRGDFSKVQRAFTLAHRCFHDAEEELKNAFYVSYLEHLDFSGRHGERANRLMSPLLLKGWRDITDYWRELGRPRAKDFETRDI